MARLPRFASPLAPERRAYFRALYQWHQTGSGPPLERSEDPLRPYRDGHPRQRRKPISLRVDESLLELARQHGLRYQAVIRLWIEEGLRRAIREGEDDPDPSPLVPRS